MTRPQDFTGDHTGQNVAWVIGTGRYAIAFVQTTPVLTWNDLYALYRLGLHFQMCGGNDD